MATSNDPNWVEELRDGAKQELRPEIVKRVNLHCYKTGRHQQDVWRSLYGQLGIPLPAKNRLDYIEEQGKMADLYRIALAL
jgi:uncharacterized protein Yka (UPF0111/DUF47 family)